MTARWMKIWIPTVCLALAVSHGVQATDGEAAERIRLATEGAEVVIVLNDNAAARDLLSMLPLTLEFDDYNHTEKIGYPPRKLTTGDVPTRCDPEAGSFTYYIPWGNLALFYRDFRPSANLAPLGTVESGLDGLVRLDGPFSARLERMD